MKDGRRAVTALKASLLLAKLIYTTKWNSDKLFFLAIIAHTGKLCFASSGRFMQVRSQIATQLVELQGMAVASVWAIKPARLHSNRTPDEGLRRR